MSDGIEKDIKLDLGENSASKFALQFENYCKEVQNVMQQDNFDGFRAEAGKTLNKNLIASHTLLLGTSMRENGYIYQFGPTFSTEDNNLMILARVGTDGVINSRFIKKIGENVELRFTGNSCMKSADKNMVELAGDYSENTWASSLRYAYQGTSILNGLFSQRITPKLHLGCEITLITANLASILSFGARYSFWKNIFSFQLSRQPDFRSPQSFLDQTHSAKLQFFRSVSDRLKLASEYEFTYPTYESALRLGYEYLFRTARVQGMVDTTGKVSVCCQDAHGFGISGTIDYVKGDYKFGFMMQFVPPDPTAEGEKQTK